MNNYINNKKIDDYINNVWCQFIDDLNNLIKIKSSPNNSIFNKNFPNGSIANDAMEASLNIAERFGFKCNNHKNIMGIAEINGVDKNHITFISHCDVVPAGPGWKFDPFKLSVCDDYLIGRGVTDDKGPGLMLLYAINYWICQGWNFPYGIRYLFGTDEETGCSDVKQYIKDFGQPELVITPDSDFPIPYSEKGIGRFEVSMDINNPSFVNLYAGEAFNAVSGLAVAELKLNKTLKLTKNTDDIKIEWQKNICKVSATGKIAHASAPKDGIDSLAILSKFLLDNNLCNKQETEFFRFLNKIAGHADGKLIGANYKDDCFGDLSVVSSMLRLNKNKISLFFDTRYPQTTNFDFLKKKIEAAMPQEAQFKLISDSKPLYVNPKSELINSLKKAYSSTYNEPAKLFTISGGTYAREFKYGISYGPNRSWIKKPNWVGGEHGPNEGMSISEIKLAIKTYINMIYNVMQMTLMILIFIKIHFLMHNF